MRLSNYLSESELENWRDEFVKNVKKDCSKWLREFKVPFYRGMSVVDDSTYGKKTPRTDRKPLDMRRDIHDKLDKGFESVFGWKCRSEGLFITTRLKTANAFKEEGKVYIIFPAGDYKYVYSNDIRDLYDDKSLIFSDDINTDDNTISHNIEKYYSNKGLSDKYTGEVMVKCPFYYFVEWNYLYVNDFKELGIDRGVIKASDIGDS